LYIAKNDLSALHKVVRRQFASDMVALTQREL